MPAARARQLSWSGLPSPGLKEETLILAPDGHSWCSVHRGGRTGWGTAEALGLQLGERKGKASAAKMQD